MAFLVWDNIAGDTTLGAAITSVTTQSITLGAGGGAILTSALSIVNPLPGLALPIAIDDEVMLITSIGPADVATVTRGYAGTTAANHTNATPIHALNAISLYKAIKAATVAAAPGS